MRHYFRFRFHSMFFFFFYWPFRRLIFMIIIIFIFLSICHYADDAITLFRLFYFISFIFIYLFIRWYAIFFFMLSLAITLYFAMFAAISYMPLRWLIAWFWYLLPLSLWCRFRYACAADALPRAAADAMPRCRHYAAMLPYADVDARCRLLYALRYAAQHADNVATPPFSTAYCCLMMYMLSLSFLLPFASFILRRRHAITPLLLRYFRHWLITFWFRRGDALLSPFSRFSLDWLRLIFFFSFLIEFY